MYLESTSAETGEDVRHDEHETVVRAAVRLVADGRFTRVSLVNIPDAGAVAACLEAEAGSLGVVVDVLTKAPGSTPSLLVRRR